MISDVFLTPRLVKDSDILGRSAVVIDVLRACSTVVVALHNGASRVLPVSDFETASRLALNMTSSRSLLGGERHGVKIDGFDLGNSPLEYTSDFVKDKTVIFKTTNGTDAVLKAKAADHILIGSLLNAKAVVDFLVDAGKDVSIVCAGWRGLTSYEDMLCAGLLLDRLWSRTGSNASTDACRIAHLLYKDAEHRIGDALANSDHGQRLLSLGHEKDVAFCSQVDEYDIVPMFIDSVTGIELIGTDTPA